MSASVGPGLAGSKCICAGCVGSMVQGGVFVDETWVVVGLCRCAERTWGDGDSTGCIMMVVKAEQQACVARVATAAAGGDNRGRGNKHQQR